MDEKTEAIVRLSCFAGVLLALLIWQWLAPRRQLSVTKSWRWSSNLALVAINSVLARLLIPVTAVAAAGFTESENWGLLSLVDWPTWVEIVLAVVLLDLAIYFQHVLFHAVPVLWRLHMVHHADLDFDVTTGLRFHTLEILISALIKLSVIMLVGPAMLAVILFEVLLNATSMFNHSNIRMPAWLDRRLRLFVVTPDMHRVHHSVIRSETNSNFGFNLPWWDYLLGTYRDQPRQGHLGMTIGVERFRDERQTERLWGMLMLPFRRDPGKYPVDGEASATEERQTETSTTTAESYQSSIGGN